MKQVKNKEKKKWKRNISRAERWTPSRLASFTENLSTPSPPPPHHYCCSTTFAVFCIPMSIWSDLVLLFCPNLKAPKFVTFKLLIYSNVPKCILVPLQVSTCWGLIPRGGTPYNGLYGEAPPEMGTFLRLQVQRYETVGISLVEVCERIGHFGR